MAKSAFLVGFGRTGGTRYDYGMSAMEASKSIRVHGVFADKKVLCWHVDADVVSKLSAQNTCQGNSGGGVLMRDDDGKGGTVQKVFAVVSGGDDPKTCMGDGEAWNLDVFQYRDWIVSAGEARLTTEICGKPLPTSAQFEPKTAILHIDEAHPTQSVTWGVPQGTETLRVAMNGEDSGTGKTTSIFW